MQKSHAQLRRAFGHSTQGGSYHNYNNCILTYKRLISHNMYYRWSYPYGTKRQNSIYCSSLSTHATDRCIACLRNSGRNRTLWRQAQNGRSNPASRHSHYAYGRNSFRSSAYAERYYRVTFTHQHFYLNSPVLTTAHGANSQRGCWKCPISRKGESIRTTI